MVHPPMIRLDPLDPGLPAMRNRIVIEMSNAAELSRASG
jgi:hypothetical protein